jgi:hypothetical protein
MSSEWSKHIFPRPRSRFDSRVFFYLEKEFGLNFELHLPRELRVTGNPEQLEFFKRCVPRVSLPACVTVEIAI